MALAELHLSKSPMGVLLIQKYWISHRWRVCMYNNGTYNLGWCVEEKINDFLIQEIINDKYEQIVETIKIIDE